MSIALIQDDCWREHVSKWLHGLKRFLAFIQQPDTAPPSTDPYQKPEIDLYYVMKTAGFDWADSYVTFMARPYASFWDFVSQPKLDILLKVLDTAFSRPD